MKNDKLALLGDEAIALAAIHAGISAAYGYPGTPSTEILQYLIDHSKDSDKKGDYVARWCSNEKTALEAGIGVSFAGRRSIVTMKHVGLNVAADAFINSALLKIKGGLVIIVADDPGMHSSQNEQDTRFYVNFAMIPCLEPRNQQEAYDMVREAFDVSEKFNLPVIVRIVTRLAHARAAVKPKPERKQNPVNKSQEKNKWMLLPAFARTNYANLITKQTELQKWSANHPVNKVVGSNSDTVIITSGLGGNYYEDNIDDYLELRKKEKKTAPIHIHIGAYPLPEEKLKKLCENADDIIVIEEGQPFISQRLFGITTDREIKPVIQYGELDPDNVRKLLGLPPRKTLDIKTTTLAPRPPQLCAGCPHCDSYETINKVVKELDPREGHPDVGINSDIGCYSLGATPPYSSIETIVCMGACVGMAKGASDAGLKHAIAVIGDSTFIHGGITALIDAVQANVPMTLIILDNASVAMTGCQPTMLNQDSQNLVNIILGCGVKKEHLVELEAKKQLIDENAAKLKAEIEYRGLSVVIFRRECLEAFRKNKKANF